jgi:phosphoglycerate dehydrogenase-like enzyme
MEILKSGSIVKALFIGTEDVFLAIRNIIPNNYDLRHETSLEAFLKNPSSIQVIIDSSIKEVIDLNLLALQNVHIVASASTGTNHIISHSSKECKSTVFSLRDIPDILNELTSAAEFSFGVLLSLARNITGAANSVDSGYWNRSNFPGVVINKKSLGIIGMGRIGQAMAKYAESFGMKINYYDPFKSGVKNYEQFSSLEELVGVSDFISLHAPYTPSDKQLPIITKAIFRGFKIGSFFINTSRGELIDEAGLIFALQEGIIKGAAIDVIQGEPEIRQNILYKYKQSEQANIIFTPHIAGYSPENVKRATIGMLNFLVKKVEKNLIP